MNQMTHAKQPISSTLRRTFSADKKLTIIRVRMPPSLLKKLQEKARRHTKGNVSQLVRHYCYEGLRR